MGCGYSKPKKDPKSCIYIELITTLGWDLTNMHRFRLCYICQFSCGFCQVQGIIPCKLGEPILKDLGILRCSRHWVWAKHLSGRVLDGPPIQRHGDAVGAGHIHQVPDIEYPKIIGKSLNLPRFFFLKENPMAAHQKVIEVAHFAALLLELDFVASFRSYIPDPICTAWALNFVKPIHSIRIHLSQQRAAISMPQTSWVEILSVRSI